MYVYSRVVVIVQCHIHGATFSSSEPYGMCISAIHSPGGTIAVGGQILGVRSSQQLVAVDAPFYVPLQPCTLQSLSSLVYSAKNTCLLSVGSFHLMTLYTTLNNNNNNSSSSISSNNSNIIKNYNSYTIKNNNSNNNINNNSISNNNDNNSNNIKNNNSNNNSRF